MFYVVYELGLLVKLANNEETVQLPVINPIINSFDLFWGAKLEYLVEQTLKCTVFHKIVVFPKV